MDKNCLEIDKPIKDKIKSLFRGEEKASSVATDVAKKDLSDIEKRSDESFIIRAEMDRDLGSL